MCERQAAERENKMPGIQDLIAAAGQAGVGGQSVSLPPGVPPPPSLAAAPAAMGPPPATMAPDPMTQLTQLLSGVASSPQGGAMMQALTQMMGGAGGNGGADGQLNRMATAQAGGPRMPAVPNGGTPENRGAVGTGPGPITDQGLTDMLNTSDQIRSDLPPAKRDAYTGADSQEGIEGDDPKFDETGRQALPWRQGQLQNDSYNGPGGPQKPQTTEEELADVSKRMGMSGDPSADGNFPTRREISDLLGGYTSEKEFDAKWGKGAAAELYPDRGPGNGPPGQQLMGDYLKGKKNQNNDDGDHEYR